MDIAKIKLEFNQVEWVEDLPYYNFTTFGVGKTAPLAARVENDLVLAELVRYLNCNNIDFQVISGGSNIVGADENFDGVIILLNQGDFRKISAQSDLVAVGAGVKLIEVALFALKHNLGGLSKLVGIPGGIGGSLVMNAGANGDCIGNYVFQVVGVLKNGEIFCQSGSEIDWNYRSTSLPKDLIITGAVLKLENIADSEAEKALISAEIKNRRSREPKGRTAGCMFKNISSADSAGRLIDGAGLKNLQIGGVKISEEHANFMVNFDHASERDVLELIKIVRAKVAEKYHFYLENEVKFINKNSLKEIKESLKVPKVLVVMGGVSSEREVSLRSGKAIATALRNANFDVTELDVTECKIYPEMVECDVVYIGLHGGFGENGELQKLLEDNNIKFVGSSSAASKLVMDKILSKELADSIGIPTAKWAKVRDNIYPENLKLPVVLKVPNEGSTVGIEVAKTLEEYQEAIARELAIADEILVEEFIEGVEITVPIVVDKTLTPIEIHSPHGFYDYDAKYVYNNGKTEYYCPVKNAEKESIEKAKEYSLKFFHVAKCKDILRVDFIINKDGVPFFLEANNLPGSTATSLVPKAAKYDGMSFEELVSTLVSCNM